MLNDAVDGVSWWPLLVLLPLLASSPCSLIVGWGGKEDKEDVWLCAGLLLKSEKVDEGRECDGTVDVWAAEPVAAAEGSDCCRCCCCFSRSLGLGLGLYGWTGTGGSSFGGGGGGGVGDRLILIGRMTGSSSSCPTGGLVPVSIEGIVGSPSTPSGGITKGC